MILKKSGVQPGFFVMKSFAVGKKGVYLDKHLNKCLNVHIKETR